MKKQYSLLLFLLMFTTMYAQLWNKGDISKEKWNIELKNIKVGDTISKIYYSRIGGAKGAVLGSSWLKAEGQPPQKIKYTAPYPDEREDYVIDEFGEPWSKGELEWRNEENYNTWAAMYSPENCFDGKTDTAWCEGVKGDGIGEVVIAHVDITKPVRIWTGFGKSQDIWEKNNRPKEVKVYIIDGERVGWNQNGLNYKLTVKAEKKLVLKDINGWQKLDLDEYNTSKITSYDDTFDRSFYDVDSFIAIKILSVYPGTKYHDTLITEISN